MSELNALCITCDAGDCQRVKDKVADKHPSNVPALIEAIKLVRICEIPEQFCKN